MNLRMTVPLDVLPGGQFKAVSVTEKTFLLFSIPVFFFLLILGLLVNVQHIIESEQESFWQAKENTTQAERLLKSLVDADNYLLMAVLDSDHKALLRQDRAVQEIKEVTAQLRFAGFDNPAQDRSVRKITTEVVKRLAYYDSVRRLIEQSDRQQAFELLKKHKLSGEFARLPLDISALLELETAAEGQHQLRLLHTYQSLSWQLGLSLLAAILFTLLAAITHKRWVTERISALAEKAQQATKKRDGSLFNTSGSDEISSLARAMSKMAETLSDSEDQAGLTGAEVLCSLSCDGNIHKMGRGCLKAWGYTPADLTGKSLLYLMVPEDKHVFSTWIQELKQGKHNSDIEICILHKDGSRTFSRWFGYWNEIDDRICAVAHDITAKKLAEQRQSVQYAVTSILSQANHISAVAEAILDTICQATGWLVGAFWIVDKPRQQLRCVAVHHLSQFPGSDFISDTRNAVRDAGQGLVGKTLENGRCIWVRDLGNDLHSSRVASAINDGLKGAISFPVTLRDEVLGVLEFYSTNIELPDEGLLQMFAAIGGLLGQFMERSKLEELAHKNRLLDEHARVVSSVRYLQAPMQNTERILSALIEGKSGPLEERQLELLRKVRRGNKAVLGLVGNIVEEQRISLTAGSNIPQDSLDDTLDAIIEYCSKPAP